MENAPAPTKSNRFVKGVSGNPLGRPKGSKNKITLMKLALEGELRTQLKHDAQEILQVAIAKAKEGDTAMLKLLVDKMIPTSKATDDEPVKERVQVFVSQLAGRDSEVKGRVINSEGDEVDG